MTKITLNDVADLSQPTTAAVIINSNSNVIETAFDNTLSRDGTAPNSMRASIDMDSNRIINLPAPLSNDEPLRLQDLADFVGGTLVIPEIPTGGTTGQVLAKSSGVNYATAWVNDSSLVNAGSNITITGTNPATIALTASPTITGTNITGTASGLTAGNVTTNANLTGAITSVGNAASLGSFSSANLATALTDETGSGANVFATSPTLVTPVLGAATATTINGAALDNLAWTTWVSTVTPQAGSITTLGTIVSRYKQIGKIVHFCISIPITTNGTGSGYVNATLPVVAANFANQSAVGRDNGLTGKNLGARIVLNTSNLQLTFYDGTYPGANGATLDASGFYEVP